MKTLLTLFVLLLSSSAMAKFPDNLPETIIFIIFIVFNNYITALVVVALGIFILVMTAIYGEKNTSAQSINLGFLGIGLILFGFFVLYTVLNHTLLQEHWILIGEVIKKL